MAEDEMVGWHHRFSGHEFEQTLGDREGQGGLVCCSSWDCKELDTIQCLNNKNNLYYSWTDNKDFGNCPKVAETFG